MHGVAKALLKSASVVALLSGGLLLLPSPASAQFPFPNIQFRVPYGGGGGGGGNYRTRHHKAHEKRSHDHSDDDDEPADHGKSTPQPLSAPMKDAPPPPQPPQGGGSSAAPPQPAGGDEPTFSPSR